MTHGHGTAAAAWMKRYSFDKYLSGIVFLILSAIAVARAFQHVYLVDINEPFQYSLWLWHVPFNLFMWWNWFLFVPVMSWTMSRLTLESSNVRHSLALYFVLPILIIGFRQAAAAFITTSVLADKTDFLQLLSWRLVANPWLWLDLIVYFAILLGLHVVEYRQRTHKSALRKMQLQTQYARAQLIALRSQLHPHFLFNTLNTISTLILKEDNPEAERMLVLLNNFLHTTALDAASDREVTLRDELRFIGDYLEIEKVRFSDKLTVCITADPDTLGAVIPGFLLQPVVENAIYHAIAVRPTHGTIAITARRGRDGSLDLFVEDNGPGFTETRRTGKPGGIGLAVTRERLEVRYGSAFRFLTENKPEGGARVTITVPLTTEIGGGQTS